MLDFNNMNLSDLGRLVEKLEGTEWGEVSMSTPDFDSCNGSLVKVEKYIAASIGREPFMTLGVLGLFTAQDDMEKVMKGAPKEVHTLVRACVISKCLEALAANCKLNTED